MNDSGGNFADELMEMASEGAPNTGAELRKRRSTRIVQAVPLVVTGVDALGRPFVEHTSSLIINCHGCRYQSKHYVLKNMWVTLEVPHPETGQPPRTVRGRVAWIQRPRTVRQLFQIALELESAGNVWGIAFPPEDWFALSEEAQPMSNLDATTDAPQLAAPASTPEPEAASAVSEAEIPSTSASDNLRVFPSPVSTTDASLQLARQVARLVADARQQIAASAEEVFAQRNEQKSELEAATESLKAACQKAEETAARLRTQAEQAEAQISGRAETVSKELEETAKREEEAANAQREALQARAAELQQQAASTLTSAQASSQEQISRELEVAQTRLRDTLESVLAEAQDRAAGGLNEHMRALSGQLQEEMARHAAAFQEASTKAVAELEEKLARNRDALQEQSQRLETAIGNAAATSDKMEQVSEQLQNAQQQALAAFQAHVDNLLKQRQSDLQRESNSLSEQIHAHIQATFEEASSKALQQFGRQIEEMVQPHVSRAEEAVHRLAGGRSLLDAALTLQQDRIRNSADEAFAESLARFQENLGGVEQILQESSQSITGRNLLDLEAKVSDLKHQVVEELFKSAEWYEKKAQTQIQAQAERAIEQTVAQLRDKAGDVSSVFATELDHSSRNFVGHTQSQLEEVVRDSFERARRLFAEVADTTAAAFTDEIQRTARQELGGYMEELKRSTEEQRAELAQRVASEQEAFLKSFRGALDSALKAGVDQAQKKVSEGFVPLLEHWKSMTDAHQKEMLRIYGQMGEKAAEHYKNRLEGISNQWMLATVASLDHQSREMISSIAATSEEKLREACARVFEGVGEAFRERLVEMAKNFTPPSESNLRSKSAKSGS